MNGISKLHTQFTKGVAYFKSQWANGNDNPAVRRQLPAFEREVIKPFDKACLAMTDPERKELENHT